MISGGWKMLVVFATLLAAVAFLLASVLFVRATTTTERTNNALCTFRADVQQRATNTEKFLREHPQGIPGIPAGTLRQGLVAQRRTVKALRDLDCPAAHKDRS